MPTLSISIEALASVVTVVTGIVSVAAWLVRRAMKKRRDEERLHHEEDARRRAQDEEDRKLIRNLVRTAYLGEKRPPSRPPDSD